MVNEDSDGEYISFEVGDTFHEGEVLEGVSETDVRVYLTDGSTLTINIDRIRGTLLVDHPDIGQYL